MAFRCGQNIQTAKCYSKSKISVEMHKIWCRKPQFIDPDQKKYVHRVPVYLTKYSIMRSSMGKQIRSRKPPMTSRIEKRVESKKKKFEVEILSRDCERTLTSDIGDSVCFAKGSWQAYTTPTVCGICTFAVFFSVSRPFCSVTLV